MRFRSLLLVAAVFIVILVVSMTYANAKVLEKNKDRVPVSMELKVRMVSMDEQDEVPVIVMLKDDVKGNTKREIKKKVEIEHEYKTINGISGKITKEKLDELIQDDNVLSVTLDGPVYATMTEALPLVNGTIAQKIFSNNINLTGAGQTVCVLDSGTDYGHFNLGNCTTESFSDGTCGKVVAGWSWCNNTACTQQDPDPMDDEGHGTHVSGIIASNDTTYTGVAPGATIVSLKVLNNAGVNPEGWSDVVDAIDWCVNNATKYNITVISMSIGSSTRYTNTDTCTSNGLDAVHIAIKNAVDSGMFVSVSSGNNADKTGISYPSCSPNATSVGSVYDASYGGLAFSVCTDASTSADKVSCFSNGGALLDLLAPGSRIVSAKFLGGTITKDGTSMACPVVSGAAALLNEYKNWEAGRNLTAMELRTAFVSTGTNVTDTRTGAGSLVFPRLDIYSALLSIDNKAPVVNLTSPSNITYNYTQNLMVNYTATDIIGISSCTYSIDNGANVTLTDCSNVTFNTTNGAHNFTLHVLDDSGNLNTTIIAFDIDFIGPNINLISHSNGSSLRSGVMINFTINDTSSQIDAVWWQNNTDERNNVTNEGDSYYVNTTVWVSQIWQNVTLYANDSYNNTASEFYRFVNNSVPLFRMNISQYNWSEDNNLTLNLSNFFNDTDSNITYSSTTPSNITVSINQTTSFATLIPESNFFGINNIFFYANDSFVTNTSDNATLNVTSVNDVPLFMSFENKTVTQGYGFSYNINASDGDEDELNYSVVNVTNLTVSFINFTINSTTGILTNSTPVNATGWFMIYLNVTDDKNWTEDYVNVTVNLLPVYDNFMNGITTNFTSYNDSSIDNVTNLTIGIPWVGLINFTNQNINLSTADLDTYVTISYNSIGVDSNNLPQLNKPARLTLYNLTFSSTPLVFKDGSQCADCTVIGYTGGNFTFDVTGFSTYTAATTTTTSIAQDSGSSGSGGGSSLSTSTTTTETTITTTVETTVETTIGSMKDIPLSPEEAQELGTYILILVVIIIVIGVYVYFRY